MQSKWKWGALTFFLMMNACATAKKKEVLPPPVSVPSQPLVLAPPAPPAFGPDEVLPAKVANPDQVVLVLGPGMVQGYACVGVLKSLREMKIPIRSIYASEVCAWVSALYLTQPTLNRMDWAIMQFGEDALFKERSGLRMTSPETKLEAKLQEIFGEKQLEELKPPLRIPLIDVETGVTHVFEKGKIKEIIRAALSTPRGLAPGKIEGREYQSASASTAYAYVHATKNEGYPIFLFETEKVNPVLLPELATLEVGVVSIPVRHISNQDFKKRNEAIYLGKRTTQEAKARIFERLGRTE